MLVKLTVNKALADDIEMNFNPFKLMLLHRDCLCLKYYFVVIFVGEIFLFRRSVSCGWGKVTAIIFCWDIVRSSNM